jgi:hypothetical protein
LRVVLRRKRGSHDVQRQQTLATVSFSTTTCCK